MSTKNLKGSSVLITGASRGLGAAIAEAFAQKGAHILMHYHHSKDKATAAAAHIRQEYGVKVDLLEGDLTHAQGVDTVLKTAQGIGVDILVLNALGDWKQGLFLEQQMSDFERALDFGMRAPVRLLQGLLPRMIDQKFGRIVSVLSTAAFGEPPTGFSSYIVNKKALEGLTKSIAVEYGRHNICANMISPNMMRTDLTAAVAERAKQLLEAQTPLKRLATVKEVAASVVYLCSPEAAYVNGHNLILSGGSTIV